MSACRARSATTLHRIHATMPEVGENAASANVNIASKPIAEDVFVIHAERRPCAMKPVATHLGGFRTRRADSESRFLATNKFSCSPASRLIGARQNRIFARIAGR